MESTTTSQSEPPRRSGTDKAQRYKWQIIDRPGRMMLIDKGRLCVDGGEDGYQRLQSETKVLDIVRSWSWMACGVLIVALRDGIFYIVDGQHRWAAARKLLEITNLPCLVFDTVERKEEAKAFLGANTFRRPLNAVERFKGEIIAEERLAKLVAKLLQDTNRKASSSPEKGTVRCLSAMKRCATENEVVLMRIFPLVSKICKERPINRQVLESLFYIEKHLDAEFPGMSLTSPRWQNRLLDVGADRIIEGGNRSAAFHGKSGAKP